MNITLDNIINKAITKVLNESTLDRLQNVQNDRLDNHMFGIDSTDDYTKYDLDNDEGDNINIIDSFTTLGNFFAQYIRHGNKQAELFYNQLQDMKDFVFRKSKQQNNLQNGLTNLEDKISNKVNSYTKKMYGADSPFDLDDEEFNEVKRHFQNDPNILGYLNS